MPYAPPAGNAVNFNFVGGYTAPGGNAVKFAFGSVPAPSFANGKASFKTAGDRDDDDPLARRRLTSSPGNVAPVVATPTFRRLPLLDPPDDDWRPPQRRFVSGVSSPASSPTWRRTTSRFDDLPDDLPPRARSAYAFFSPSAGVRPVLFVVT
jgi:hypothetical protein